MYLHSIALDFFYVKAPTPTPKKPSKIVSHLPVDLWKQTYNFLDDLNLARLALTNRAFKKCVPVEAGMIKMVAKIELLRMHIIEAETVWQQTPESFIYSPSFSSLSYILNVMSENNSVASCMLELEKKKARDKYAAAASKLGLLRYRTKNLRQTSYNLQKVMDLFGGRAGYYALPVMDLSIFPSEPGYPSWISSVTPTSMTAPIMRGQCCCKRHFVLIRLQDTKTSEYQIFKIYQSDRMQSMLYYSYSNGNQIGSLSYPHTNGRFNATNPIYDKVRQAIKKGKTEIEVIG